MATMSQEEKNSQFNQYISSNMNHPSSPTITTPMSSEGSDHVRKKVTRSEHPEMHFNSDVLGPRYSFTKYLGHGSYGHVAKALDTLTGKSVAIKKISNIFANATEAKRILREIRILRLCNHENIIKIVDLVVPGGVMHKDSDLFIIFEFVDTDLDKLLRSHQFFSNLHIQYMFYQMVVGIKHLHNSQIVHRDMKPANILVNEDCTIKICDFGLARWMGENSVPHLRRMLTEHVVTRWYRAPEVILVESHYSESIDMWSCGCILAEMLNMQEESISNYKSRKPLFPGDSCFPLSADSDRQYVSPVDQLNIIFSILGSTPSDEDIKSVQQTQTRHYLRQLTPQRGIRLHERWPGADPQALDLLQGLLMFNPDDRLTVNQVLEHPYLREQRIQARETRGPLISPMDFEFESSSASKKKLQGLIQREVDFYKYRHSNGTQPIDMNTPAPSSTHTEELIGSLPRRNTQLPNVAEEEI